MPDGPPRAGEDRRWPRTVFGVGTEPDPRFTFANERTFLAWIRTALRFIAAGVAIAAVGYLSEQLDLEVRVGAVLLILGGLAAGLLAWFRWAQSERALRLNTPLPSSPIMPLLSVALGVVAVLALIVVVLE